MEWYEDDVKEVIARRELLQYSPLTIFYGSSTIRLWESLYDDFRDYKPVNLGFGGSTLAACIWFFDRIVVPLKNPERFIIYAGDNDLGDGRHPEEVCLFYKHLILIIREYYKNVPCYFISVKPSLSRVDILDKIEQANLLIKEEIQKGSGNEFYVDIYNKMILKKGKPSKALFDADGLHLDKKGYEVWKEAILQQCFD